MQTPLGDIRERVMESMGRISSFWGFSEVMGQIYGLLYLSPKPLTLDGMSEGLSISKGNASVSVRSLQRWNMAKPVWVKGDRKDYYEAERDFWKIIKGVLREREKKEFAQALASMSETREMAEKLHKNAQSAEAAFVLESLRRLEEFIATMDRMVGLILTLEDLKKNFLGLSGGKKGGKR